MKKSMSLLLTGALLLSACSSPETSQTEASTAEQTTQAATTAAATEPATTEARTEEEGFVLDTTGKKNGRGVYICYSRDCFQKAVKNKGLERSFKQAVPAEVYGHLEKEMEEIETG